MWLGTSIICTIWLLLSCSADWVVAHNFWSSAFSRPLWTPHISPDDYSMKLITLNILGVHNYLKNGLFFLLKTHTSKPTWKCSSKSRPLLHGNFFILVVQARHKSSPKIRRYHVCGRLKKNHFWDILTQKTDFIDTLYLQSLLHNIFNLHTYCEDVTCLLSLNHQINNNYD